MKIYFITEIQYSEIRTKLNINIDYKDNNYYLNKSNNFIMTNLAIDVNNENKKELSKYLKKDKKIPEFDTIIKLNWNEYFENLLINKLNKLVYLDCIITDDEKIMNFYLNLIKEKYKDLIYIKENDFDYLYKNFEQLINLIQFDADKFILEQNKEYNNINYSSSYLKEIKLLMN